jgi:hypothetical protein
MKEAGINAKQAGERGISAKSVKKVTEVSIGENLLLCIYLGSGRCPCRGLKAEPKRYPDHAKV